MLTAFRADCLFDRRWYLGFEWFFLDALLALATPAAAPHDTSGITCCGAMVPVSSMLGSICGRTVEKGGLNTAGGRGLAVLLEGAASWPRAAPGTPLPGLEGGGCKGGKELLAIKPPGEEGTLTVGWCMPALPPRAFIRARCCCIIIPITGKRKPGPEPPPAEGVTEEVVGIFHEEMDPPELIPPLPLLVGSVAEGSCAGRRNGWFGKNGGATEVGVRAAPPTGGIVDCMNGISCAPGCF